jgi:hypothetical protein
MLLRQRYASPTVTAPTYLMDVTRGRLTIDVRNPLVLFLVPQTIQRARCESSYAWSMEVVIDCRRCSSLPSLDDIRNLSETLSGPSGAEGPIAILAPGVPVAAVRYRLDQLLSPWAACQVRVFDNEASLETWLGQSPTPA